MAHFIIFDLEWNQCPYGKAAENEQLPFEIIEIGAVKLAEDRSYVDTFHALVKPSVYKKLHYQTKKVVSLTEKELAKGMPFPEAADAFFEWCGADPVFCTWGPSDLPELQRNLFYYRMGDRLKGPILYLDIQKLFAIYYETRSRRRSLSYAVDFLDLPEDGEFHLAREDAVYTARIFRTIPDGIFRGNYSVDCFQNPKSRKEEVRLTFDRYEKFISKEYRTREEIMADGYVTSIRCFVCGKKVKRVLRYFTDGTGRNHIGCGFCPEHGYVKCKIRVREASSGCYYAIRTTKMIDEEELEGLRLRHSSQNHRKK